TVISHGLGFIDRESCADIDHYQRFAADRHVRDLCGEKGCRVYAGSPRTKPGRTWRHTSAAGRWVEAVHERGDHPDFFQPVALRAGPGAGYAHRHDDQRSSSLEQPFQPFWQEYLHADS